MSILYVGSDIIIILQVFSGLMSKTKLIEKPLLRRSEGYLVKGNNKTIKIKF